MDKRTLAYIGDNLRAFVHNFGPVRIEREYGVGNPGYYVFCPADSESYVQYCYNRDYLNGWLYGCVQGALILKLKEGESHE